MIEKTIDKYLTEAKSMRKWKVTRTWYIDAEKATDAITLTKNKKHDEVNAKLEK